MDKVILLKKHLEKIIVKETLVSYNDEGVMENTYNEFEIEGAFFPVSSEILKLFAEGAVKLCDVVLYSKYDISHNTDATIERKETGERFRIYETKRYTHNSDLRKYILQRLERE